MFKKLHARRDSSPESIASDQGSERHSNRRSMLMKFAAGPVFPKTPTLSLPGSPRLDNASQFDGASQVDVDLSEGRLPRKLVPALTLLRSHSARLYMEGYIMVLHELNNDGEPVPNRQWTEVFATLRGSVLTMHDAALAEKGKPDAQHVNIADSYLRGIDSFEQNLQNVIVLSSTMKNRYLLQFGTKKPYTEWTAALRLACFEQQALQEAYTGALLSYRGAQLHGIRSLLTETKFVTEFWCDVRFGAGMPWKRVFLVLTPSCALKDKKERRKRGDYGKIELFNDPRDRKKKRAVPLATVNHVFSAFAVFPEKPALINASALTKMECTVEFDGDGNERESALYLMPEQRPGVSGSEALIRFLIPVFDVFQLYGRPKRLNADKNDIHSLLFGMPALPRSYYLDVLDVYMLAALPESESWPTNEWMMRIKELIASKMASGYTGTGSIRSAWDSQSISLSSISSPQTRPRATSEPHAAPRFDAANDTSSPKRFAPAVPSPLQHSRVAPRAPRSGSESANSSGVQLAVPQEPAKSEPSLRAPRGPRAEPVRVVSEGNFVQSGLLSPNLQDMEFGDSARDSRLTATSRDSFVSASEKMDSFPSGSQSSSSKDLFDPTLKPSHRSYADYSEYMRQYLNNLSTTKPSPPPESRPDPATRTSPSKQASQVSPRTSPQKPRRKEVPATVPAGTMPAGVPAGTRPAGTIPAGTMPAGGVPGSGIISALESDDTSDDTDISRGNTTNGSIYEPTDRSAMRDYEPKTLDPKAAQQLQTPPGRAQLLSTPMRTPEVSQPVFGTDAAAASAMPAVESKPSTAMSAPKISAYPNAPGSPYRSAAHPHTQTTGAGSQGSLVANQAGNQGAGPQGPQGKYPPGGMQGAPQGTPYGAPQGAPQGAPHGAPHGAPRGAPQGAPQGTPQGAQMRGYPYGAQYGQPIMPGVPKTPMGQMAPGYSPSGSPMGQMGSPMGQMGSPMGFRGPQMGAMPNMGAPMQMRPMGQMVPQMRGQPMVAPVGGHYMGPPMGPVMGQSMGPPMGQSMAPAQQTGSQAGSKGVPPMPGYMPMGPAQGYQSPGKVAGPRPLNELRAEQKRSAHAQAMNY